MSGTGGCWAVAVAEELVSKTAASGSVGEEGTAGVDEAEVNVEDGGGVGAGEGVPTDERPSNSTRPR